jgi:hypothetical protein
MKPMFAFAFSNELFSHIKETPFCCFYEFLKGHLSVTQKRGKEGIRRRRDLHVERSAGEVQPKV